MIVIPIEIEQKNPEEIERKKLLEYKQKLEDTKTLFIENQMWNEVSEIQYKIDTLNIPEESPKLETWFSVALFWHLLKEARSLIAKDIYVMKKIIKEEQER